MNRSALGPLSGVRVLDTTSVLMGPYATLQLGDLGADVIKVEGPDGDIVRDIGPSRGPKMGGMFLHTNRSKRSIVLDLKVPEGRAAFLRLAATADIIIFNMRPRALARLGLSYEQIREVRPDVIFVGLVGFGQDGPYAAKPAYDDLIQGASGIPSLFSAISDGTPRYAPVNIADRVVGLFAAQAVLAALLHRERTGEGQSIEVPMFETMASFVMGDHMGGLTYRPPLDAGGYARLMSPYRRPYQTVDGHICVLIYTDKQWRSFFSAVEKPELAEDERFANLKARLRNIDHVYSEAGRILRERTTAEWHEVLERADIPNMPMHTLQSIQDDAHLKAVGFFEAVEHPSEGPVISMRVPSRWSRSQPRAGRPAPTLGQHSREILAEAGLTDTEINGLIASGAAREPAAAVTRAGKQEDVV